MPKDNNKFDDDGSRPGGTSGGPPGDDEMRRGIRESYRRLINDINSK